MPSMFDANEVVQPVVQDNITEEPQLLLQNHGKKQKQLSLGSCQILPSAPRPTNERRTEEQVSLKDLIPFWYPAGTPTPLFEHMPKSLQRRYIKVKEPLFDQETSKRIYWQEMPFDNNDEVHDHDHGCFFFLKISIRRMIDKWFGPLFGLTKFDEFHY
ncbi:hypothetical protein Bca101_070338 [Brassica carinata]